MSLIRPLGIDGTAQSRLPAAGDVLGLGEVISALATAGAGTWTGAIIATGLLSRTGPGAGYTDTTDSAANILAALAGNAPNADVQPGTTFRFRILNTVAFLLTFAAGAGVVAGSGTLNVAASTGRDYLFTVLSSCPLQTLQANTVNATAAVTFVLPPGAVALPFQGSNGPVGAISNLVGATVTGAGIAAGTTVLGVTQGQGGAIGVTLSANATATSAAGGTPLTFQPTIRIDSLGGITL